jgi:YHS domain-containing protein
LVSSFADNDDLPVVETALPAGWVELVDESSGQSYYFNEDDNITQWESPVAVRKDDAVVVIDSRSTNPDLTIPVNEVAPVIEGPATNVVPSLPLGWVELIDESSGKAYFFNEKESLTQWNKPMEIPHSKTLKSSIGTSIKASTRNDASTSQDEWVKVDASSIDLSQTAPVASKKRLPVGWAELIDPSSGKTYYFNKEDTITQWERPEYNLSASFTEFRLRPPHAIASFGFGGRLCIMKPQIADSLGLNKASMSPNFRKGPIEIHRLSELLPEQYLPSKSFRSKSTLNGPFVNFSESEVLQHLKQKSGQCKTDNELLWNLVAIAARWKGSLRSADGYSNKNGPEAAIVDLLLRNENIISDDSSMSPIFIGTRTSKFLGFNSNISANVMF